MDIRGTAILVPNQYRGVYAIRKHLGKYDAICQTNGKVETMTPYQQAQTELDKQKLALDQKKFEAEK